MPEIWTKRSGLLYDAFEWTPGLWVQPFSNRRRFGVTREQAVRRLKRAQRRSERRTQRRLNSQRKEN